MTRMQKDRALQILRDCPERVPIIIIQKEKILTKTQFIVPRFQTLSEFMFQIRKSFGHENLKQSQALYLLVGKGNLPMGNSKIGDLYDQYKNENLMLVFTCCLENAFGFPC